MNYVMLPVPEDFVMDVMQHVLSLSAQASYTKWSLDSVDELFTKIDEPSRALLSIVAAGVINADPVAEIDAEEAVQLTRREMLGLMRDLNDLAEVGKRPSLIMPQTVTAMLPNGREQEVRKLTMKREVAALIQEVDRKQLMAEPHPLADEA